MSGALNNRAVHMHHRCMPPPDEGQALGYVFIRAWGDNCAPWLPTRTRLPDGMEPGPPNPALLQEAMPSPLHLIGRHAARRFLNFRLGWQLFRDPRVSVAKKGAAVSIGIIITLLLIVCEVPLEGLLGLMAPLVGVAADVLVDGAELVLLPLIIAMAILPYMARPRDEVVPACVGAD